MFLNQKDINSIQVLFTFQNSNESVYFNKGDWEINLEINFYKALKPIREYIQFIDNYYKGFLNYENNEKKQYG